ncbi:MAG TPA: chemotaxis protein CheW [Candidatus Brocadiia bacterium]|nr:chemotaxis protein CheW [Candidatus Brocadiia bacterium]
MSAEQAQPPKACWNDVGVGGSRACPRLKDAGHCANCPRFGGAGSALLDREPPEGYEKEWAALLARAKERENRGDLAVVVFRIGGEWLALPAAVFQEVTESRRVHGVPHRSGGALLGVVNVRGEVQLCVSLARLLGLDEGAEPAPQPGEPRLRATYRRLVVARQGAERWVFPVDEMHGLVRFNSADMANVPVTVAKAKASFTLGLFAWESRSVGLLDAASVFAALGRSVQ